MNMELRVRNHDMGFFSPTFQERLNTTLPTAETSVAPDERGNAALAAALTERAPATPRYLNNEEVQATLSRMEEEARLQNLNIVEVHSGLNEQRVARLLGLLD
jgi:hypothetical protein